MAKMLTYVQNDKGNAALHLAPDENYAREVMQLFSIGLIERNLDFSPKLDNRQHDRDLRPEQGHRRRTRVHRLELRPAIFGRFRSYPTNGADWTVADYLPLFCYEIHHDETPRPCSERDHCQSGAELRPDIAQLLSIIAQHANVRPFISRQLIQRFTTSNPSPAYIERIAHVFLDDGHGTYGDLGASSGRS
jgi:uncharacterized protein (DUF1800 family)